MKANRAAPTGEWREESTVFADVEPMMLEGASVRVYDCAGQVGVAFVQRMGCLKRWPRIIQVSVQQENSRPRKRKRKRCLPFALPE